MQGSYSGEGPTPRNNVGSARSTPRVTGTAPRFTGSTPRIGGIAGGLDTLATEPTFTTTSSTQQAPGSGLGQAVGIGMPISLKPGPISAAVNTGLLGLDLLSRPPGGSLGAVDLLSQPLGAALGGVLHAFCGGNPDPYNRHVVDDSCEISDDNSEPFGLPSPESPDRPSPFKRGRADEDIMEAPHVEAPPPANGDHDVEAPPQPSPPRQRTRPIGSGQTHSQKSFGGNRGAPAESPSVAAARERFLARFYPGMERPPGSEVAAQRSLGSDLAAPESDPALGIPPESLYHAPKSFYNDGGASDSSKSDSQGDGKFTEIYGAGSPKVGIPGAGSPKRDACHRAGSSPQRQGWNKSTVVSNESSNFKFSGDADSRWKQQFKFLSQNQVVQNVGRKPQVAQDRRTYQNHLGAPSRMAALAAGIPVSRAQQVPGNRPESPRTGRVGSPGARAESPTAAVRSTRVRSVSSSRFPVPQAYDSDGNRGVGPRSISEEIPSGVGKIGRGCASEEVPTGLGNIGPRCTSEEIPTDLSNVVVLSDVSDVDRGDRQWPEGSREEVSTRAQAREGSVSQSVSGAPVAVRSQSRSDSQFTFGGGPRSREKSMSVSTGEERQVEVGGRRVQQRRPGTESCDHNTTTGQSRP